MAQSETIEKFVEQQLKDGAFESYDEMVVEGLALLRERIQCDEKIADELLPAYERGMKGHAGLKITLEDVKRLSAKYRTQGQSVP